MTSTILATFDRLEEAHAAVDALSEAGFKRSDIGLAVFDRENEERGEAVSGAGFGTAVGTVFGAFAGLVAITIPGIGPIIAAGPIAAALGAAAGAGIGAASGAVTGGITGSLLDFGVPEEDVDYYAETLRQGAALVSVTAHEFDSDRAQHILSSFEPIDIDKRVAQWRARGWSGYDPKVEPYTAPERTNNPDATAHRDLNHDKDRRNEG